MASRNSSHRMPGCSPRVQTARLDLSDRPGKTHRMPVATAFQGPRSRSPWHVPAFVLIVSISTTLATGCKTLPPPEPDEIQAQALGELDLSGAWEAGTPNSGMVQDNWLASFGDEQLNR